MCGVSPERKASNKILRQWAPTVTGDVLSIGSAKDRDGEGARYRDYFCSAQSYTTSEVAANPWCDLVLDVRKMTSIADERYHGLFASGVFEHVDDIWAAIRECYRVLRREGVLLMGVPFWQPIHRAPQDFWRFTEYGVRHLVQAFVVEDLVAIGAPTTPGTYWVKARKA